MASKCGFAMAGIGGRAYFPHPEGLANPYLKAHDIGWPNPWQPYWQRLRHKGLDWFFTGRSAQNSLQNFSSRVSSSTSIDLSSPPEEIS